MDLEDIPLLHFPDLALAVLRAGAEVPATLDDAARLVARSRTQAREHAPIDDTDLIAHLNGARLHLKAAHAIEMLDTTRFRITPRGMALLRTHADGVDDGVLTDYPEFRAWLAATRYHGRPENPHAREFGDGWVALLRGAALEDNPFPSDTAQHEAWRDGWRESDRHLRE